MTILQITTATSGTVNVDNTQQNVILVHDAGLTLNLTVNFPTNPKDGQTVIVCSSGGIIALILTSVVGSVLGALTGMAANTTGRYVFSANRNKWFKY